MENTLQLHRDYMKDIYNVMTVGSAQDNSEFVEALYATEARMVRCGRYKCGKNGHKCIPF